MFIVSSLHVSVVAVAYTGWLESVGPWLLAIVAAFVLIETGLLFPFLPGDTLLFAAAVLAGTARIPIPVLIGVAAAAGIAGDQIGYGIGRRFGRGLFTDDARILKTAYLVRTDAFFARYGAFAVVLARFAPIVRTFVPPLAGASTLRYRVFLRWNVIGGLGWATIICCAGLLLGRIPFVGSNLDIISAGILLLSVVPFGISFLRGRHTRKAVAHTPEKAGRAHR